MALLDLIRTAAEAKALELASLLSDSHDTIGPGLRVERASGRILVIVQVLPFGTVPGPVLHVGDTGAARPEPFHPTECCRDILDLLRAAGRPLVLSEIRVQLEGRNRVHGESTVKKALAAMVRRGVLKNPGHRVGYSVAALSA